MKQLLEYEKHYNGSEKSAEHMGSLLLAVGGTQTPKFLKETLNRLQVGGDQELAGKVLSVHAPLAARLNLHQLKAELEDVAFKISEPERYKLTSKLLLRARANAERELAEFKEELSGLLNEHRVKVIDIKGRRKSPYSVYRKLQKKGDIGDIHDLLALRLIVPRISDCYNALDVIHSEYEPTLSRMKDYIARPKGNGYQSLHTTVRSHNRQTVEIQIRTTKMDKIAEGGEAAYWLYDKHKLSKGYRRGRAAAAAAKPYGSRVFVFSPAGDVYSLPAGATSLDFAFAVHTSVGLRTKGVRVNSAITTLEKTLENGDQVEIITGKQLKPRRDWLQLVQTARAKNRIRAWLKTAERERYLNDGRTRLLEEFEGKLPDNLGRIAAEFKLPSEDDLFVAVGGGYVSAQKVFNLVYPPRPKNVVKKTTTAANKTKGVIIAGMDGLSYRLAKCCKPQSPRPITGYITRSLGITVHAQGCPHLEAEEERVVECYWQQ